MTLTRTSRTSKDPGPSPGLDITQGYQICPVSTTTTSFASVATRRSQCRSPQGPDSHSFGRSTENPRFPHHQLTTFLR